MALSQEESNNTSHLDMPPPIAPISKEFERLSIGMEMVREAKSDSTDRELTPQEKGNLAMELRNLGSHFLRVAKRLGINEEGLFDLETTNTEEMIRFAELNAEVKQLKEEIIPLIQ